MILLTTSLNIKPIYRHVYDIYIDPELVVGHQKSLQ